MPASYNPANYSCGLWIAGTGVKGNQPFSVQTNVNTVNVQGGHVGARTSGAVQGCFFDNATIIGNDYGLFANHLRSTVTELVATGPSSTFNCRIANIWMTGVGYVYIGEAQHNHFAPVSGVPWTCVYFNECNDYTVCSQYGTAANTGTEYGFWDQCAAANTGQSTGRVAGWGVCAIAGPWLRLKGTVVNKAVTGQAAYIVGAQDVDNPLLNSIFGGSINSAPMDFTSDGKGDTTFLGTNLVASNLLPYTTTALLGGGGAYTWYQVWTAQVVNTAGPVVVNAQGLNPVTTNSQNLGSATAKWASGYFAGNVYCNFLDFTVQTYATLPAPAGLKGLKGFISDSTTSTFYATVTAGGGTLAVPVFSDGTNWRVG